MLFGKKQKSMEVINFAEKNSVVNRFMAELRDVNIQNDRIRFRRNLERIGEIRAYEISHRLHYSEKEVTTPLGTARVNLPDDTVVLATILRAGLPFHQGFLSCLDDAENAFVSAYRKYKDKLNFDIFIEYIASPRLDGKVLVITDPMLATGGSMESTFPRRHDLVGGSHRRPARRPLLHSAGAGRCGRPCLRNQGVEAEASA